MWFFLKKNKLSPVADHFCDNNASSFAEAPPPRS